MLLLLFNVACSLLVNFEWKQKIEKPKTNPTKKLLGGSGHQLVTAAQSTPSHSNSQQQQHQVNNRGVCGGGGAAAATTTTSAAAAAAAAAAANLEALANAYTAGIQQFTTGAFVHPHLRPVFQMR